MTEFSDINEALAEMSKRIAIVSGEAVAGRLLAIQALDLLLFSVPDPAVVLAKLDANIDGTINQMYVAKATPESAELDELSRESARVRCYELLDALRRRHEERK